MNKKIIENSGKIRTVSPNKVNSKAIKILEFKTFSDLKDNKSLGSANNQSFKQYNKLDIICSIFRYSISHRYFGGEQKKVKKKR